MDISSQNSPIRHVLQTNGVLKSFNINREVSKKDLSELYEYLGIDESTADEETKQRVNNTVVILSQMQLGGKIPGLLSEQNKNLLSARLPQLFYISSVISEILMSECLSEKECSFVLSKTIKDLGLQK